jgi:outer membrane lipoprotein SlyB
MKTHHITGAVILFFSLGLSGCATYVPVPVHGTVTVRTPVYQANYSSQNQRVARIEYGTVTKVEMLNAQKPSVAGNASQRGFRDRVVVTVRTDSGAHLAAEQPLNNQVLRLGDRVKVQGYVITRIEDRQVRKR